MHFQANQYSFSGGNVGIGTTSPDEVLHVNGNIEIEIGGLYLKTHWTNYISNGKTSPFCTIPIIYMP